MKNRFILLGIFVCLFISACGKTDVLSSGTAETDSGFISGGIFVSSAVKLDSSFEGLSFSDAEYITDRFYYLFRDYTNFDIRLISFDTKGSDCSDISFQLPFSAMGNRLLSNGFEDELCNSDIEGLTLQYFDPIFVRDSVSGYCNVTGIVYSVDSSAFVSKDYLITWDLNGAVKSVEEVTLDDDDKYSVLNPQYVSEDADGNVLTVTESGVIRSLVSGEYVDTYFDFVNSSYTSSIDKVVYANEDTFSALSYDADRTLHFAIFNRSEKSYAGVTPISLYCSYMSSDLKDQIVAFNTSSKNYRIGVRNYCDIYRDYSETYPDFAYLNYLALSHLEEDVLSGDVPDLIYEYAGLDEIFVSRLSSSDLIVDLKDAIKNDKALKGNKYLINIYDLYEDSVPCIIPSFTFDTYVASVLKEDVSRNWTLDEYVDYKSLTGNDIIIMDSYSSYELVDQALAFNGNSWIEISTANATFGDDYKKYLILASQLPDSYDDFVELSVTGQIPVDIQFFSMNIGNLAHDYLMSWRMVSAQPINIGFPTNTGSDRVIHPSGALMLCSDRVALPGSWEFASSFLSTDYQDGITDYIPVLESSFEKWKTNTSYEGFEEYELLMTIDGQMYTAPMIDQAKVDLLSNNILSCDKYYFNNPQIEEIVLRNASYYFDGSITVDEAALNTEQEVEEYLKSVLNSAS